MPATTKPHVCCIRVGRRCGSALQIAPIANWHKMLYKTTRKQTKYFSLELYLFKLFTQVAQSLFSNKTTRDSPGRGLLYFIHFLNFWTRMEWMHVCHQIQQLVWTGTFRIFITILIDKSSGKYLSGHFVFFLKRFVWHFLHVIGLNVYLYHLKH